MARGSLESACSGIDTIAISPDAGGWFVMDIRTVRSIIRIERHPLGARVRIGRWRIHHWHSGVSLIVLGGWWIYRDREDIPWR